MTTACHCAPALFFFEVKARRLNHHFTVDIQTKVAWNRLIPSMVRAIRNVKTGEYFNKGKWTPNSQEAQKFDGVPAVVRVCAALGLNDVEMVLLMEHDNRELRIPIPNR